MTNERSSFLNVAHNRQVRANSMKTERRHIRTKNKTSPNKSAAGLTTLCGARSENWDVHWNDGQTAGTVAVRAGVDATPCLDCRRIQKEGASS